MTDTLTQRARDVAGRLLHGEADTDCSCPLPDAAAIISELVERIEGAWQDIGTAPRDGTRVLLIDMNGDSEVCWGELDLRYPGVEWRDIGDLGCNGECDYAPTHWLPLPQPPSVLGKQEGEG